MNNIRIFPSDETVFTGMGLGGLPDAISCMVTEDLCGTNWRGGEYTLEMEYPITGRNYDLLVEERIICAIPNEKATAWQPFRIYSITRPIGGVVTVKADHISRQLRKITSREFDISDNISDVFDYIETMSLPVSIFELNKTGTDYLSHFTCENPRSVFDVLCGSQCILDQYRPDAPECYTFDKWNVTLGSRGSDSGVTISYGKNMTEIEKTSDMTDTITGYMPYWKDDQGEVQRLSRLGAYDDVVYAQNYESYVYPMVAPLDAGSVYSKYKEETTEVLAAAIIIYAQQALISVSALPANISVKFVDLSNTDQYKDHMKSRMLGLGDTVTVRYLALGIDEQQRVIKTVYNVLLGRYDSIEIGTKQINLAGVIAKIAKRSK